jgi:hypothetical protein
MYCEYCDSHRKDFLEILCLVFLLKFYSTVGIGFESDKGDETYTKTYVYL